MPTVSYKVIGRQIDALTAELNRLRAINKEMMEALEEVRSWNNSDIRAFDDIAPDLPILRARRRVIAAVLKKSKGK